MNIRRFPVQVALGALVLFVLTLSWGVTINSLPLTAKIAGWDWQPMTSRPLFWLLTLPLRVLPTGWIPVALNLFSAVCAAAVIGILARSIELLRWRRPLEPDARWRDKLPGLVAGALCALEFNFWQDATAASGEMLDLLLLAGALWCLMEYRVCENARWLDGAAVLWGLGLAENWLMVPAFPVFVAAMIWLRRKLILDRRFPLRMCLLGVAGFSIYLLPPLVNGLWRHSPWSLGEAFAATLKASRHTFGSLAFYVRGAHLPLALAVIAFYLVPVLPCLMRSPEEAARLGSGVTRVEIWIYRVLRLALLLACLWLTFDPALGPRQLAASFLGLDLPLLSFDYATALGAGFMVGTLLQRPQSRRRNPSRSFDWLSRLQFGLATALVGAVALVMAGLLLRNTPAVLRANRQTLRAFGALAVRSLPAEGGVVLSDDPLRLLSFQAALSGSAAHGKWLAVDTRPLRSPAYRAKLERRQPGAWLTADSQHELSPVELLALMESVASSNRVVYLHPSYGELLERFYLQPYGTVFEVNARTVDRPNPSLLTAQELEQTENTWNLAWKSQLESLSGAVAGTDSAWPTSVERITRRVRIGPATSPQSRLLGEWFSAALNCWGVELQRAERLPAARQRFEQALALNPNNWVTKINFQVCTNLLAGNRLNFAGVNELAAGLDDPRKPMLLLSRFGWFDEPVICYLLGWSFERLGLPRQAAQQFERSRALAPDVTPTELALADAYVRAGRGDKVLELVQHIRVSATNSASTAKRFEVELAVLEASGLCLQTNAAQAHAVLQSALQQHPNDDHALDMIAKAYLVFGDFTNAQEVMASQRARRPDDHALLDAQASLLLQLGDPTNALTLLTRLLTLTNLPSARLNRAGAALLLGDLIAAEADYLELEKAQVEPVTVQLGLAEVASRRRDTNQALARLAFCLSNAPAGSVFWQAARARLDTLKPEAPRRNQSRSGNGKSGSYPHN